MKKRFLTMHEMSTWRVWRSGLSARERIRGALVLAAMVLAASAMVSPLFVGLWALNVGVALAFAAFASSVAFGIDLVSVGRDRIVLRGLLGRQVIRGDEIRGFRYVGRLPYARQWFVETSRGSISLGDGKWSNPIVEWILRRLPNLPRPDPTWVDSLTASDQYRGAHASDVNLLEMVKLPSLSRHERRRIAGIVVAHGDEGKRVVSEVAESCIDEEERQELARLAR